MHKNIFVDGLRRPADYATAGSRLRLQSHMQYGTLEMTKYTDDFHQKFDQNKKL